jgi:hypothetical protein
MGFVMVCLLVALLVLSPAPGETADNVHLPVLIVIALGAAVFIVPVIVVPVLISSAKVAVFEHLYHVRHRVVGLRRSLEPRRTLLVPRHTLLITLGVVL